MRNLNKVFLLGNLTRDPELRYTPGGQSVASFGVATNRRWRGANGEIQESVEFHDVVAWGRWAELTSQLLYKGRPVFIEGRMQTRSWEGQDGVRRQRTEVILENFSALGQPKPGVPEEALEVEQQAPPERPAVPAVPPPGETPPVQTAPAEARAEAPSPQAAAPAPTPPPPKKADEEEINLDEIPF